MSILAMIGMDHLPKGTYSKAPDRFNGLSYAEAGWQYATFNTNNSIQITEDGCLASYRVGGADASFAAVYWPIGNSNNPWGIDNATAKLRFGFRLIMTGPYVPLGVAQSGLILGGDSSTISNILQTNPEANTILYLHELPGISKAKAGDEYYIEYELPRAADNTTGWPKGRIFVDGQLLRETTQTAAPYIWLRPSTTGGVTALMLSRSTGTQYKIRDIVISDNVDRGDGFVDMVGPIRLKPLTVKEVVAPDWVVPEGLTAKQVIDRNLGYNNEEIMTNYLRSPAVNSNLELILEAPAGVTGKIMAISSSSSWLKESGGQPTRLFASTIVGGDASAENELSGSLGLVQVGKRIMYQPKAPDGGNWTVAKLDQLRLRFRAQVEA